ncbi:MAG TPA: thiamine-phosphate kinase [Woeseiaceae bacterium]|nr:thiamine-phosphate kinase [Woeseiaceae bacterium]
MDEFELINRYFRRATSRDDVCIGVGDDGAVTEVPAGRQLVSVLDTVVEGVHYPRGLAAADVGYRAVAVNLSDLAAMGAVPAWMLLGLSLPAADAAWLQAFADGLYAAAAAYDVALIGGDTTRAAETVVTVQMTGYVAPGRYLTRAGARPGDTICVSGTPGDAAAGLAAIADGSEGAHGKLAARFRRPQARIALGQLLVGVASAAIDVSDGLYADLERLLEASACGGVLECTSLPLSPQLLACAGRERAESLALGGGDDYELCFTVPAAGVHRLGELASATGVTLSPIGTVAAGQGLACTRDGEPIAYAGSGYRHFRANS